MVESCEHGNKLACSIKGIGFLNHLCSYLILKKDSVAWSKTDFITEMLALCALLEF